MKINLVLIFGLVCLIALSAARPAEEEYSEYEDEPAPPPKKTPARAPIIGRRNPLSGRANKASSTTAAPPPPEEEAEENVEEEEAEQQEQTSSTTEAPKKFLKGGIVRPFRSNDELLATLKRRREQVAHNKHSKPVQASEAEESAPAVQNEPAPKTSRPSAGGRRNRFNTKTAEPAATPEEQASTAAPARTGRRFNARS